MQEDIGRWAGNSIAIDGLLGRGRLICVRKKLDAVEVQGAVTNGAKYTNPFGATVGKIFNFDLRTQGQIGDGKQAHADIAEIDAESIHLSGVGE